jgi:hypothetical protein
MGKWEKNLVQKPKYEVAPGKGKIKGRQMPTMTFMSKELVPNSTAYIEIGWVYTMPDPNPHVPEHDHSEHDEYVIHIGSNPDNPEDLGGEIEFVVGGEPLKIDKTSVIYIPAGVVHGPLTFKRVDRPMLQMTVIMGAGSLAEAAPGGYKGE